MATDVKSRKRNGSKKRKVRPSEAQVKFEGKKADVAAFEEYCNNVRALLQADAFPDVGTFQGLCHQLKTTLPGDRLRKLALEQSCSRHLEFILEFVNKHVTELLTEDEEHDARVEASLNLIKHFLREFLGHCAHTARADYGSHLLEKLFSTIPTLLKHTKGTPLNDAAIELQSAMRLNLQEMIAIQGEDGLLESGVFWELLEDPRATCVLRTLFAVSVGCRLEKSDSPNLESICDPCCSDALVDFATTIFSHAGAMEWVYKNVYVSQRAAPTLQVLLLALLKINGPTLSVSDEKMIKQKLIPHRLDGSIDVDYLDHLVKDTGAGNRMVEFIIGKCLDGESFTQFIDQYLLSHLRELAADSKGNFIVKATIKATSLKAKYLKKILQGALFISPRPIRCGHLAKFFIRSTAALDWTEAIGRHPGVIWAAVDAAASLNTAHAFVLKALEEALGTSDQEKGSFWASLLLMVPRSNAAALSGGRVHSLGVSIGQSILNFPIKSIAKLVDSFIDLMQKPDFPLKQTACHKQVSYLYQKLIQLTAGSARFGPVVATFTPMSRSLALHPTGSFVLGELLTNAKVITTCARQKCALNALQPRRSEHKTRIFNVVRQGEERQSILKQLQSMLTELRTRNFSLYKKHGLGSTEKKITASDSRFQHTEIATKKISRKKHAVHKPKSSIRNLKK